jgi:hypothetical protein
MHFLFDVFCDAASRLSATDAGKSSKWRVTGDERDNEPTDAARNGRKYPDRS